MSDERWHPMVKVGADRQTELRRVPCSSCGAPIVFVQTAGKRVMPLDADAVIGGRWGVEKGVVRYLGLGFEGLAYRCHWQTCPQASQHRRHHARQK